ncbi:hypothetical protein Fot_56407 [Forsythia ovata]|uniref:Uncharacterized protein n=1 Tax=Forsythia ovata TaxID=205694 RepID=A0ABD1P395_9LAMI
MKTSDRAIRALAAFSFSSADDLSEYEAQPSVQKELTEVVALQRWVGNKSNASKLSSEGLFFKNLLDMHRMIITPFWLGNSLFLKNYGNFVSTRCHVLWRSGGGRTWPSSFLGEPTFL